MNTKSWWKPFLIWFWSLFFGGLVLAFVVFWLITEGALGYLPPLEELQNPKNTFASEVISADMQSLGRYYRYENRVGVDYADLSPNLIHALVATEDVRFYNHTGVDFKSMFRAILKLGRAGGGSTLTQQLAAYTRYDNLSTEIRGELAALFPQVSTLGLSRTTEASRDTTAVRQFVTAVIRTDGDSPLTPEETRRLHDWLQARVRADSLVVVGIK